MMRINKLIESYQKLIKSAKIYMDKSCYKMTFVLFKDGILSLFDICPCKCNDLAKCGCVREKNCQRSFGIMFYSPQISAPLWKFLTRSEDHYILSYVTEHFSLNSINLNFIDVYGVPFNQLYVGFRSEVHLEEPINYSPSVFFFLAFISQWIQLLLLS